ncbi:MAG TPA: discoidin domain-containing protein, partial [Patescibacteria group bacterium]|nr:discoidin domain-containing protein [Patescibacteria group bacterium]
VLEYSQFIPAGATSSVPSQKYFIGLKLNLSLAAEEAGSLAVQYPDPNNLWQTAAVVDLPAGADNASHGGYFSVMLPSSLAAQIVGLPLRLVYSFAVPSAAGPIQPLDLDGVNLEADYLVPADPEPTDQQLAELQNRLLNPQQFLQLDFSNKTLDLGMPGDLSNPITIGKNLSETADRLQMLMIGPRTGNIATRENETVTYAEVFPDTDVSYRITDTSLKEAITLKGADHPGRFRYLLNLDNYDYVQTEPNRIDLYKKGHKGQALYKLYSLTAPQMTDASGRSSDRLKFSLRKNLLTLIPDAEWLKSASYPVIIDPTVEISVLNVVSYPVAGGDWNIDFTTAGTANLTVTPADQATIDDMQFLQLTCGGAALTPQQETNGAVFYPDWNCDGGIGEISFLDLHTGHHHMIFNFGGVQADAWNGAVTYTGASGGNWETGSNWSSGSAPGPGDDVVINNAVTVNLNAGTSINSLALGSSGGGTAAVLNFNYDAAASPLAITTDFNVYASTTVTHATGTSAVVGRINLAVGGNALINGTINADYKGYGTGFGPGAGSSPKVGASYGGLGGVGDSGSNAAPSYGSTTLPTDLGSGSGSGTGTTGPGGGAIKLTVAGTTTLSGIISANGTSNSTNGYAGAASGGSIYLSTARLAGSGTIRTNGGSGNCWFGNGGGGGGGRIAVYYATDVSTIAYQSYGGAAACDNSPGGAGSIYKKSSAQSYGDLTFDNNNIGAASLPYFGLSTLDGEVLNSLTIKNSALLYMAASSATATTLTLSNNGTFDVRPTGVLAATTTVWSSGGVIRDSGGSFSVINQNQDLAVPSGGTLVENVPNSSRSYNNVTVSGTLTSTNNDSATTGTVSLYKINLTANGNLTVNSTGKILEDAGGYHVGQGPGAGPTSAGNNGSGGSYGGLGGYSDAAAVPSVVYGSLIAPTDLGSGGGRDCGKTAGTTDTGLWGGGAVILNVTGTTTVSGTISANGSASEPVDQCWSPGAGSGGSVYLTTSGLAGSGTISANGGSGSSYTSGGGGRVAIYYDNDTSAITYQNYAGSWTNIRYGGAGTVYKKKAGLAYGDLTLKNNSYATNTDQALTVTPVGLIAGDPLIYNSITIGDSAALVFSSSTANTLIASASAVTLLNNGLYDNTATTTLNYGSLVWTGGMIRYAGGGLALLNSNQDLTVPSGSKLIFNIATSTASAVRSYNNLTVNGILTHNYNSATTGTASLVKLNLQINGNLTVASGGSINVDGRGYPSSEGPGAGGDGSNIAGGGSYGGAGGAYATGAAAGPVYGSTSSPVDLGSGGGGSPSAASTGGGSGGGAIILNVTGTTTVSGVISANGTAATSCNAAGGGAGGSIYLSTGVLLGTASTTANGGNGCGNGGSGGGGRISILSAANASSLTRFVSGGAGAGTAGGSGTLYPADNPIVSTQAVTNIVGGTNATGNGSIDSFGFYRPAIQYGHVWDTSPYPYLPNTNMVTPALGGTATSSKINQGAAINAFDNSTSTYWGSSQGAPYDLEYDFPVPSVVNKYVIIASAAGGDAPKDWQFQAWDGSTWVNLQSVSSQTGWAAYESRAFSLVNTTGYSKYRLYISTNNGGTWTRLSELQLINTSGGLSANGATNAAGSFTSSLTGLSPNTTYYTRAYVTTLNGTTYGDNISFSTGSTDNPPNPPSSLGPNQFVSDTWGTTTAPALTFNLSDADASDTVAYRLILDNDSNFSSPLIDYTSASGSQGGYSFAVGQPAGSGSYAVGSAGQTLPDGSSYYWEVQAIDGSGATSSFVPANSGSIAFKVDTVPPVPGTISYTTLSGTSMTVNIGGSTDSLSGVASYRFTNLTTGATSTQSASNSWFIGGLTPNTQYSYNVLVTDAAGNASTSQTSSRYTSANTPTSPTSSAVSSTSILLSWNANNNPVGTEYYAENASSTVN